MDIGVNERIKSYLKDPTLYYTVIITTNGDEYDCYAWSDGDDIQTAEDISVAHLLNEHDLSEDDVEQVTTHAELPL